jgi:hypothetical protein
MDKETKKQAVAALRARRAARGMDDPLNRLRAIGANLPPVVEVSTDD